MKKDIISWYFNNFKTVKRKHIIKIIYKYVEQVRIIEALTKYIKYQQEIKEFARIRDNTTEENYSYTFNAYDLLVQATVFELEGILI
jgi:hypothetical protein